MLSVSTAQKLDNRRTEIRKPVSVLVVLVEVELGHILFSEIEHQRYALMTLPVTY